jgi:polysaccharide export outer membrane protein
MFGWIRIAITVGALLTIASELRAAEFGSPYSGNAPTASEQRGKNWCFALDERKCERVTPSVNSAEQTTSNMGSPRQDVGPMREPSAARAADALTAAATPGDTAYKIGPLDVLDISVFQAPELSKTVEVASNGTIDVPLLGETPVVGKSAYQLQQELNLRYGAKYLQNPQVTVSVKQFNSSRVTISGAVNRPGVFPYKGETLLQFVTMAGGLAPEANSMVVVLRQSNGARSGAKFNLSDIEAGRTNDPAMQPGDLVVADTSVVKKGFKVILTPIMKVLPLAAFAGI